MRFFIIGDKVLSSGEVVGIILLVVVVAVADPFHKILHDLFSSAVCHLLA